MLLVNPRHNKNLLYSQWFGGMRAWALGASSSNQYRARTVSPLCLNYSSRAPGSRLLPLVRFHRNMYLLPVVARLRDVVRLALLPPRPLAVH